MSDTARPQSNESAADQVPANALGDSIAASRANRLTKGHDSADLRAMLAEHQRSLEETARWDAFPPVGTVFPDFSLPDAHGRERQLRGFLGGGPLVVVFYRGGWCPYCSLALRAYQRHLLPSLVAAGGRLVAISPQLPDSSLTTQEMNELAFDVLSDVGNALARALNLSFPVPAEYLEHLEETDRGLLTINGDDAELLMPATFVLDPEGVIRFADVRPNYIGRTEPAEILEAALALVPTAGVAALASEAPSLSDLGFPADLSESAFLMVVEDEVEANRLRVLLPGELAAAAVLAVGSLDAVESTARALGLTRRATPWIALRRLDLLSQVEAAYVEAGIPGTFVWPLGGLENELLSPELLSPDLFAVLREVAEEQRAGVLALLADRAAKRGRDASGLGERWEREWRSLVDGRRVLADVLARAAGSDVDGLVATMGWTLRDSPELVPDGLARLRTQLRGMSAADRTEVSRPVLPALPSTRPDG
jgi:peroxiredoxin